jgi:hypothetical protein
MVSDGGWRSAIACASGDRFEDGSGLLSLRAATKLASGAGGSARRALTVPGFAETSRDGGTCFADGSGEVVGVALPASCAEGARVSIAGEATVVDPEDPALGSAALMARMSAPAAE